MNDSPLLAAAALCLFAASIWLTAIALDALLSVLIGTTPLLAAMAGVFYVVYRYLKRKYL